MIELTKQERIVVASLAADRTRILTEAKQLLDEIDSALDEYVLDLVTKHKLSTKKKWIVKSAEDGTLFLQEREPSEKESE